MRDPNQTAPLILGTRASPLALAQSQLVAAALCVAHGWPSEAVALAEIITKGDKNLDTKLAEIGGKGLFTQELEAGLHDGSLDLAVHSLKDLPTISPDGLTLAAILPRAPAADLLIARTPLKSLDDVPQNGTVGTASLRRQAQILAARPDIKIVPLRGNIQTRLKKLHEGGDGVSYDAIILAEAGLARMDMQAELAAQNCLPLDAKLMLPAAGQGALAVQCRSNNAPLIALLSALHCADSAACVTAERSFLNALDGSCRTPIAAHATLQGEKLTLHGRVLAEDGSNLVEGDSQCARHEAEQAGRSLAARLRDEAPHLMPKAGI